LKRPALTGGPFYLAIIKHLDPKRCLLASPLMRSTIAALFRLSRMTDIAFFRLPTGQAWLGLGPFEASADKPSSPAFYCNDFDLSCEQPWLTPSRLIERPTAADLAAAVGEPTRLRVLWEKPPTEGFKMAFRRIRREVLADRLEKMVPVLTERGHLQAGSTASLLHHVLMPTTSGVMGVSR